MIKVTMTNEKNNVDIAIQGHALEAPYGHDVVCAAVSVLFAQLQVSLRNTHADDDGDIAKLHALVSDAGDVRMIASFQAMIEQLAEQYPKNVSFETVNANGGQG